MSDITSSILGTIDETRPPKKAFTSPGPYPFSPAQGYITTVRKITLALEDVATDPNYFDVNIEFECATNMRDQGDSIIAFDIVTYNNVVVGTFTHVWKRDCQALLQTGTKRVKALQFNATERAIGFRFHAAFSKQWQPC